MRISLGRAERLGIDRGKLHFVRAETYEELLTAGEDYDLYRLSCVREHVENQPRPMVIGEHERIVQDHGSRSAPFDQHFGKGARAGLSV